MEPDVDRYYRVARLSNKSAVSWDRYDHPDIGDHYENLNNLDGEIVSFERYYQGANSVTDESMWVVSLLNSELYFWLNKEYLDPLSPLEMLAMESI